MTSFMGPMAPPPPAQPQPQALDIRTDPNQRQQFKQFMRQRMMPMTSAPIAQPPMQPMMQSPAMFNMGGGVDIFDPMYSAPMMAPPAPMGFDDGGAVPSTLPRSKRDAIAQKVAEMMAISAERVRAAQQNAEYNRLLRDQDAIDRQVALDRLKADQAESRQNMTLDSILSDIDYERRGLLRKEDGGAVPPRRADIGGQDHMLSYITPDEADILKALGGSGEAGPMGIPAFRADPGQMAEAQESLGQTDYGGGDDGGDSGDTYSDMGMSPGRSQAQFGTTEFAGKSEQEAQNIVDSGGGSDEAQAVQQSIATQQRADAQRAAAAEAARQTQIRNQQIAQDNINRTRDRVQAGLAQRNVGVGTTPEVNLTVTRNPTPTTFNVADTLGTGIAPTVQAGPRGPTDGDVDSLDLLDLDNLLDLQGPPSYSQIQRVKAGPGRSGVTAALDYPGVNRDTLATGVIPRDQSQVLLSDLTADPSGTERFGADYLPDLAASDMARMATADAGMITDASPRSNQVVLGGGTDDMGSGVPLGGSYDRFAPAAPTGTTTTTTPAQDVFGMEDEYLDEDIAAGFGQYDGGYRDSEGRSRSFGDISGPGGGPGRSGLSTFADRQQRAQDYAKEMGYDLTDRSMYKEGAERGFSGITQEQLDELKDRAAGSIFGDTFMNTPRNISNILEDKRATGIYTNPDGTVRGVTGLPDPDAFGGLMQSAVNFLGGFMPNFIGETYTGTGPNPFDRGQDPGGGGEDRPVKAPTDPCPDGFVMKNGACTPIDTGSGVPDQIGGIGTGQPPPPPAPVIVPSPRQPVQTNLQGPVGYGSPIAGQMAPSVASNAALYQQMLNQQAMNAGRNMPVGTMPLPAPTRLQQGGPVSSNLDRAADNFLKALMPAA
tara:strand:- start:534 stop:3182 length:2649 start_codon:yes stop_codon:yes gene_type:complete